MRTILDLYKKSYSGLPKNAWRLSFIVFINYSGTMVLFFMTLYLTQKLNFSVLDAGKIISVYGIGSLAGSYLGGWLSDKWGTKRLQLASLILSGFCLIILGYLKSHLAITVMMFLIAIVIEAFRPANSTAIIKVCKPEQRARGFALNRLASNLGITIGPVVGGFLATVNYKWLFWVDGLTCLASALAFRILVPDYEEKANIKNDQKQIKISIWQDRIFLAILGLLLMFGIVFVQLFSTWPLFLKQSYGLLENKIGTLIAINTIMIVIIEMPLIHSLQKFNPVRIITLGSLFLFTGFFLLSFGKTYLYAAFTVAVWTIGEILVFPLVSSVIANRTHESNQGRYMGMFSLTFATAFVIGPAVGMAIYDSLGPSRLWMSVGILGVFVSLGFRSIEYWIKKSSLSISNS